MPQCARPCAEWVEKNIALFLGCSYRVMPATVGDRLKVFWRVGRWLATHKAI